MSSVMPTYGSVSATCATACAARSRSAGSEIVGAPPVFALITGQSGTPTFFAAAITGAGFDGPVTVPAATSSENQFGARTLMRRPT